MGSRRVLLSATVLYWNVRKSLYVVRGRVGQCPCHDLSDSGAPGRTRCLAATHWANPGDFQRACPLLVLNDHGWCCSVGASQVRPFWWRQIRAWLAVLAVTYILGAAVAFVALREIGYDRLRFVDVAYPGNWGRFSRVQGDYYREMGRRHFAQRDFAQSLLALATVMEIDPDYETGLLLACLSAYGGSYAQSDAIFLRLLRDYPDQAERTSVVFQDQLLVSLRLQRLAELSLQRIGGSARADNVPWRRALLFAWKHGRIKEESLRPWTRVLQGLPRGMQALLRVYSAGPGEDAGLSLLTLEQLSPLSDLLTYEMGLEELAAKGEVHAARNSLNRHARELPPFERFRLHYLITCATGDAQMMQVDFVPFLNTVLALGSYDRICAALIQTKDAASFDRLWEKVRPFLSSRSDSRTLACFWITARVLGRHDVSSALSDLRRRSGLSPFPADGSVDFMSNRAADPAGLRVVLATVELPRETLLALVAEAVALRRAAAEKEARRAN